MFVRQTLVSPKSGTNSEKSVGVVCKIIALGNSLESSDFPLGRSPEGKCDDMRNIPLANFSVVTFHCFSDFWIKTVKIMRTRLAPPVDIKKPAAQAAGQTLPDATRPLGKIKPFSKIGVTFEPI